MNARKDTEHMNSQPGQLAIVGRSDGGRPRTYRLSRSERTAGRDAAYRRLAGAILGLDVAFLARDLRSRHVESTDLDNRAA
jgi:hypothetical protein